MNTSLRSPALVALGAALALAACSDGDDDDLFSGVSRTASGEPEVVDIDGRDAEVSNSGNRDWTINAGSYDKRFTNDDRAGRDGDVVFYVMDNGQDILRVDEDTLDEARFGTWLRTDGPDGAGSALDAGAFIVSTSSAGGDNIPNSGTATYQGSVEGLYLTPNDVERMTGTTSAAADFGAGTVQVDLLVRSDSIQDTVSSGVMNIDVDTDLGVRTGTFETNSATSTDGFTGQLGGGFYDDDGDEIGGTFDLTNGQNRYLGAFGGEDD